ncbi:MAG: GHKL domain-containing protein [Acinetobacter sp.]
MSIGWLCFEMTINLLQSGMYLYFIKSRARITKPSTLADALCIAVHTLFYSAYLFFDMKVTDSVSILIFWVYLLYTSNQKWYISAFWVVIKEAIAVGTVGLMLQLCLFLTSASYEALTTPGPLRVVFVLSTNLVLFLAFYIFSKIKTHDSPYALPALLLFLAINLAILFAIEMLFTLQIQEAYINDWPIFAAYGALVLCSILSVFLYHLMTDIVRKQNEARIALNQAQLTKKHQLVINDMYTDMLARQHDFKHQLQTITQLVQQGNAEKAEAYLAAYMHQIAQGAAFMTGSMAVDALLTAKLLTCKHKGIEFKLTQCPLNELPISEVDFCAVVGNLLDNAIEGVGRVQEPAKNHAIHLCFLRVWDTFTIQCENSADEKRVRKDGFRFLSSKKEEPFIHGFGISNIEQIAQGVDGFCNFELNHDSFSATVTLPFPTSEKHPPFLS